MFFKFIICFSFIISINLFADSKIATEAELKNFEIQVEKELSDNNNPPDKKFNINMSVAKEAYRFALYEKALHYFSNAIAINADINKSDAYLSKINIALFLKPKDEAKIGQFLDEAIKYFNENTKYKSLEADSFLASIEKSLGRPSTIVAKENSSFTKYISEENFERMLKTKEYQQAFLKLNPEKIKISQNSLHVTAFDTLNVLLNKKKVKELYCNKEYKKYPDAYAYSMIVCGLLNDYLKTGHFTDKKMKVAEEYFTKSGSEKKYLLEMLKEIK